MREYFVSWTSIKSAGCFMKVVTDNKKTVKTIYNEAMEEASKEAGNYIAVLVAFNRVN